LPSARREAAHPEPTPVPQPAHPVARSDSSGSAVPSLPLQGMQTQGSRGSGGGMFVSALQALAASLNQGASALTTSRSGSSDYSYRRILGERTPAEPSSWAASEVPEPAAPDPVPMRHEPEPPVQLAETTPTESMELYFDAPFDEVNLSRFQEGIIDELRARGFRDAEIAQMSITLHRGSIIVRIKAPPGVMGKLRSAPLDSIAVQGYRAYASKEHMEEVQGVERVAHKMLLELNRRPTGADLDALSARIADMFNMNPRQHEQARAILFGLAGAMFAGRHDITPALVSPTAAQLQSTRSSISDHIPAAADVRSPGAGAADSPPPMQAAAKASVRVVDTPQQVAPAPLVPAIAPATATAAPPPPAAVAPSVRTPSVHSSHAGAAGAFQPFLPQAAMKTPSAVSSAAGKAAAVAAVEATLPAPSVKTASVASSVGPAAIPAGQLASHAAGAAAGGQIAALSNGVGARRPTQAEIQEMAKNIGKKCGPEQAPAAELMLKAMTNVLFGAGAASSSGTLNVEPPSPRTCDEIVRRVIEKSGCTAPPRAIRSMLSGLTESLFGVPNAFPQQSAMQSHSRSSRSQTESAFGGSTLHTARSSVISNSGASEAGLRTPSNNDGGGGSSASGGGSADGEPGVTGLLGGLTSLLF